MQIQSQYGEIAQCKFQPSSIKYYKNPIVLNKKYSQDIIPGVYQGGFQLWECQLQFIDALNSNTNLKNQFANKSVIQIGCGHGLLGIAALKLGANQITLQDYNQNVIKQLTIPTVQLNHISKQIPVNYLWGDWQTMTCPVQYDIILGSQLIYKQENYQKVINFIIKNMKKSGIAFLANKHYYFGVGGNMPAFKDCIQSNGLKWNTILKITPNKGGNKKEIISIHF